MRIAKTLLFLSLVLVLALIITRFFFIDKLITIALQKGGAEVTVVHLSDIGLSKIQIDTLTATFQLPSGERLPVTLKDISLQYTLRQLLTTGKCNRVAIKTMEIKRTALKQRPVSPLSLPRHITLLNNELRARLPLEELHIDHLLLSGDLPPELTEHSIQVDTAVKGTTISAVISQQITEDIRVAVTLHSNDALHGTGEFNAHKGQQQIARAGLRLTPENLSGTVALQLQPLQDLLPKYADISRLPKIKGSLTGRFTLPLPVRAGSKVQADFTLLDKEEHRIQLKVDGSPETGQGSLTFSGQDNDQEFINTRLHMYNQRVSGTYALQFDLLANFLQPYLQQPLPALTGQLKGEIDIPLPGNQDRSFAVTARATRPAPGDYSGAAAEIKLSGELTQKELLLDQNATFHAGRIKIGNTEIKELSLSPAGTFRQIDDGFLLTFTAQQAIRIKGLATGSLRIDDLSIQPQKPLQISIHDSSWAVNGDQLLVRPLVISEGSRSYSTGPLSCTLTRVNGSGSSVAISSAIKTQSVVFHNQQLTVPLKNVSGSIHLKDSLLSGKFQLSPAAIRGRAQVDVKHNFAAGSGSFTLQTDRRLDLDQETASLAKLCSPWQYPFNLDSGKVSFTSSGSWKPRKDFRLTAFVAVTGGSGFFKQFLFEGLNIRQDLAVLPRLYSKTPGSFSLQHLIGGIDVYNSRADLNFLPAKNGTLPRVRINDFSASLFDGTITSPDILYNLNRPDTTFTININKINLAKLIDLIKMDSLHVTGRISGAIPVTVKGKDISVDNGELHSEPPGGDIRYKPENMNQSGITGYALKAVEDFTYHSLKATAMYLPSGQLDLDISLQGKSPGLDTNRPVNLNIHAEQNLPALIQSLRFSRGLTEKLDKRVKQHYK